MAHRFLNRLKDIKEKTDTMAAYLPYETVYYEKTADFYHIAKYAVLIFLLIFLLISGLFFHKELRTENFRYLFKYVYVDPVSTSANYKDIYYNSDENTAFLLYKGDLAVMGDGYIKLYNIAGRNIMTSKINGEKNLCDNNGKYLITYYPGTNKISIFNSFSKLYEIDFEYPIMSVSSGKDGSFTVITKDADYSCAVYVYNDAFKSVYSWKSNEKYAFSSAVSPNGKNAAILSYAANGGDFSRELSVRNIYKDRVELLSVSEGGMPVSTGFFDDSSFFALYTDGIEFYNEKFKSVFSENFNEDVLMYRVFDECIAVLTGKTKGTPLVTVYQNDGHKKFTESFPYQILDISVLNDRIYLLTDSAVYTVSGGEKKSLPIEKGARAMFVFDDGNILVCYEERTSLLKLSDFK